MSRPFRIGVCPAACAGNGHIAKHQTIVLDGVHAFRQRLTHLADALPPVIVVTAHHHLASWQTSQPVQRKLRLFHTVAPEEITGQKHHIIPLHPLAPSACNLGRMLYPGVAKAIHGFSFVFIQAERQMQVTNGPESDVFVLVRQKSVLLFVIQQKQQPPSVSIILDVFGFANHLPVIKIRQNIKLLIKSRRRPCSPSMNPVEW